MHRLSEVRVQPLRDVLRHVFEEVLACVVVLLAVLLRQCHLCLLIRFLDAQLLLSIVASSLYLLFENLIEGSTIFGVFLLLLRLVIPKVVLFYFGNLFLMLLLVVLNGLLITLLVFNELILIILLRLQLFLRTIRVDLRQTTQMLQLHEFKRIIKRLLIHLSINVPLLLRSNKFIIVVVLLLSRLRVLVISKFLLRLIVRCFRFQLLFTRGFAISHNFLIVLHINLCHTVRVLLEVLLTFGIRNAVESLLPGLPVLLRFQHILSLRFLVRLRRRVWRVLRLLFLLLFFLRVIECLLLDVFAIYA